MAELLLRQGIILKFSLRLINFLAPLDTGIGDRDTEIVEITFFHRDINRCLKLPNESNYN